MKDVSRLSASELRALLQARELRALDVVEACLERIAVRDPQVHAWACIEPELARSQARALDRGPMRGPLHGLPLGVKDIFETADLPTEHGSPIYRGHRPKSDAASVAAARAAGAIVLGKTVTTEFAYLAPAATVNPHNPAHTPGGSSSGTAAAVADGMVPVGFGTQTGGSIIRPASYCGVIGYKPTYGTIERAGVKLVAESLDTVGVLARTVPDAALIAGAIAARHDLLDVPDVDGKLHIGICRTHDWRAVRPEMAETLESAGKQLAASGARVSQIELPDSFAGLGDAHVAVQGYEAARHLAFELRKHRTELSSQLLEMLEEGSRVPAQRHAQSLELAGGCRARLAGAIGDCDVLLAPSAPGEAPAGLDSTGSAVMNRVWTLLHVPCINVPAAAGPNGLPIGLQVIGRLNDDVRALAGAHWIAQRLASAV